MCPKSIQTSIGGGSIKSQFWQKLPLYTGKSKGGSKGSKGTKGSKGKASIAGSSGVEGFLWNNLSFFATSFSFEMQKKT